MKVLDRILELLFPRKCVFCSCLLGPVREDHCPDCEKKLSRIDGTVKRGQFFHYCYSIYYYEDPVARAVKRLKFGGKEAYAAAFGRSIAAKILDSGETFDLVTWVPISPARRRKRGYNQSQEMARQVAKDLNLPCGRILKKVRDNPPQARCKDRAQRAANVINCYCMAKGVDCRGKRILLIDDVITSGATLNECSRMIIMAGADKPVCGTLAATREQ